MTVLRVASQSTSLIEKPSAKEQHLPLLLVRLSNQYGIVGPLTWKALPADPQTPTLARDSTGGAVSALQKGLLAFGGANTATDPGPIDGNFGPRTESAVRAYQTQQNIAVDGVVGDQTWWTPAGAAGATLASLAGLVTV
jgi:peptidoglycan hydrolase-like protein with peptidoglycan-binding domain